MVTALKAEGWEVEKSRSLLSFICTLPMLRKCGMKCLLISDVTFILVKTTWNPGPPFLACLVITLCLVVVLDDSRLTVHLFHHGVLLVTSCFNTSNNFEPKWFSQFLSTLSVVFFVYVCDVNLPYDKINFVFLTIYILSLYLDNVLNLTQGNLWRKMHNTFYSVSFSCLHSGFYSSFFYSSPVFSVGREPINERGDQYDQVTAHQCIDPVWCPRGRKRIREMKESERERRRDLNLAYRLAPLNSGYKQIGYDTVDVFRTINV